MTQYDNLINQISFLEDWFKEISPYINNVNPSDEFSLNHLTSAKKVILKKAINSRDYFKDSSFSLIHYDLNPGNIIKRDKGGVLFLDWRQASVGDRAMDISKFFYKNYLNEEQEKLFLNYYLSEIDDTTLKARIDVYSPLIRLASLLWRLRFLNIDLKNHPRIVDGVNSELVSQRLTEDYQYLINKYYEN